MQRGREGMTLDEVVLGWIGLVIVIAFIIARG